MFESTSVIIAALSGASWVNLKLSGPTGAKLSDSISNSATALCSGELIDSSLTADLIRLPYWGWTKLEEWQLSKTPASATPCLSVVKHVPCSHPAHYVLLNSAKDIYCLWNESQSVYDTLVWDNRKMPAKNDFFLSFLYLFFNNSMSRHISHVADALRRSQMQSVKETLEAHCPHSDARTHLTTAERIHIES